MIRGISRTFVHLSHMFPRIRFVHETGLSSVLFFLDEVIRSWYGRDLRWCHGGYIRIDSGDTSNESIVALFPLRKKRQLQSFMRSTVRGRWFNGSLL